MLVSFYLGLSLVLAGDAFQINNTNSNSGMVEMLDMMQNLMTGSQQFDRKFIKEIRTCMASFDPQLPAVHDATWQGIIDYWDMRGNPDDIWGLRATAFDEYNVTVSSLRKMTIHEPCNFASNVAHYYLLLELCHRRAKGKEFSMRPEYMTALGKMIAALPVGSSFMHATNTKLGIQQDDGMIQIIAYLMHQAIIDVLPYRSAILTDLSPVARPQTALEIADTIQKMHATEPVEKWFKLFDAIDMPDYFMGFAGSGITLLHMNFDDRIVDWLLTVVVDSFGLTEEHRRFLTNDYLPELRRATPNLDRKKIFRNHFSKNSLGSVAKLLYAFLWQENALIETPIILKPIVNAIGALLLPKINKKFNLATNFQYFQPNFQRGVNIYPGEEWCNPKVAHAKWHVQSAIAFVDIIYLCDEMNRLLAPS